jgi:hypothetical protein
MNITGILVAALLAVAPGAFAQKKDHHDDPRFGGVVIELEAAHLELVAKGSTLTLHVYGPSQKPIDLAGAKAQANVFSGKDKATLSLVASGPGVMTGDVGFNIRPDAKVVVTFVLPKGKADQARFQLGTKPDHKGHKH